MINLGARMSTSARSRQRTKINNVLAARAAMRMWTSALPAIN
ncbi:MAG TPA: hypothetical protein VF644_12750 [Pyrinomonadaceae bacterium]